MPFITDRDGYGIQELSTVSSKAQSNGGLRRLGLFHEEGIASTKFYVERKGETLTLVPTSLRGGPVVPHSPNKRDMTSFSTAHRKLTTRLYADTVQDVRALGSDVLTTLDRERDAAAAEHGRRIDVTHEYERLGAVKGKLVDADGNTLEDLHDAFGIVQNTHSLNLAAGTTNVPNEFTNAIRKSQIALGDVFATGYVVLTSASMTDTNSRSIR